MAYHWFVTRVARSMDATSVTGTTYYNYPGNMGSFPDFGGVRIPQFQVVCVVFWRSLLGFCLFSVDHFIIVCPSIEGLWLALWNLQTFHKILPFSNRVSKWSNINLTTYNNSSWKCEILKLIIIIINQLYWILFLQFYRFLKAWTEIHFHMNRLHMPIKLKKMHVILKY